MANKKKYIILIVLLGALLFGGVIIFWNRTESDETPINTDVLDQAPAAGVSSGNIADQTMERTAQTDFFLPLPDAKNRVTKKPFGIFITPQNSPVSLERFSGFHTGTDFEMFPEELSTDVSVAAICQGKIVLKKNASGYGGVLVESCSLEGSPITVIYGHLNLGSINKNVGDELASGEEVGLLGKDKSLETDGERKHLHLGIHKGENIDILGYVRKESDLSDWIDVCSVISCH